MARELEDARASRAPGVRLWNVLQGVDRNADTLEKCCKSELEGKPSGETARAPAEAGNGADLALRGAGWADRRGGCPVDDPAWHAAADPGTGLQEAGDAGGDCGARAGFSALRGADGGGDGRGDAGVAGCARSAWKAGKRTVPDELEEESRWLDEVIRKHRQVLLDHRIGPTI